MESQPEKKVEAAKVCIVLSHELRELGQWLTKSTTPEIDHAYLDRLVRTLARTRGAIAEASDSVRSSA